MPSRYEMTTVNQPLTLDPLNGLSGTVDIHAAILLRLILTYTRQILTKRTLHRHALFPYIRNLCPRHPHTTPRQVFNLALVQIDQRPWYLYQRRCQYSQCQREKYGVRLVEPVGQVGYKGRPV